MFSESIEELNNRRLEMHNAEDQKPLTEPPPFLKFKTGERYISPKAGVVVTERCGLGIAAKADFAPGELVAQFNGFLMSLDEYFQLPEEVHPFPHQVGDIWMYGPRTMQEVTAGELINHSCEPNIGFRDAITAVAMRRIEAGEQLTLDYAFSESFEGYNFKCQCGSKNCRGVMTSSDWKNPDIYRRNLNYFQPYLKEKLSKLGFLEPSISDARKVVSIPGLKKTGG